MTTFELLLEQLPANQRVEAALTLENLCPDRNSPIYGLYALLLIGINAQRQEMESRLSEKAAASEAREKQLADQLTKAQSENLQTQMEIRELSGKQLWKRIIASRIIGAAIWVVTVATLTTYIIDEKIRTVDPKFHEKIVSLEAKIQESAHGYQTKVDRMIALQEQTTTYFDSVRDTNVTTARETLIGKGISYYVQSIGNKTITLQVGERSVTMPHHLTDQEYLQLKVSFLATGDNNKIE